MAGWWLEARGQGHGWLVAPGLVKAGVPERFGSGIRALTSRKSELRKGLEVGFVR